MELALGLDYGETFTVVGKELTLDEKSLYIDEILDTLFETYDFDRSVV